MTTLPSLALIAALALYLTYRSASGDSYHSPAAAALLALVRTLSIITLAALILFWSWTRVPVTVNPVSGLILIDDKTDDRATVGATVSRLEAQVIGRGGRAVNLVYNADRDAGTVQDEGSTGRFTDFPSFVAAIKWLILKNPDMAIALLSGQYPPELKDPDLKENEVSWFRPTRELKVDQVLELSAPRTVFTGQAIRFEAKLAPSMAPRQAVFSLNGSRIETREVEGSAGPGPTLDIEAVGKEPGISSVELKVLDGSGTLLSVNTWPFRILSWPSVIYISPDSRSAPLARHLARTGLEIRHMTPYDLVSGAGLSSLEPGGDTVIIVDSVPGAFFSRSVVATLYDAAHRLGGTVIILPGTGATNRDKGGPLERLMPVKLGLEKDSEKPAELALVAVVDASMSMFFNTDGISSFAHNTYRDLELITKISMAKKAVTNLAQAIPDSDRFGVLTVTDKPSWIIRPSNPREVDSEKDLVSRIEAFGPGINLYSALLASYNELAAMDSEVKHILVFLDTADVDEYQVADRGTVWDLLEELREQRVSVSLIGFGNADDAHIPQLNRFAEESGGYFYLTSDIREIPGFGLMDLEQVTESLLNFQAREVEFFSSDFPGTDSFPNLSGQVVTTLKPGASLFAWSDRQLPLVAAWPFGKGRVAVITADGGQALAREWKGDPDAWTRILARIMTGEREDTELFYSPSQVRSAVHARTDLLSSGKELAMVASFPDGTVRSTPMEKIAADQYVTDLHTSGSPPSLLELTTSDGNSRLAMQIVQSDPAAAPAGSFRTPPFNPPPAGSEASASSGAEPLILRLLILLSVFLLAIDEFFRPPGVEDQE